MTSNRIDDIMHTRILPAITTLLITLIFAVSARAQEAFTILHPSSESRISKVRSGSIIGSLDDENVAKLQLRIPFQDSIWVNVATKSDKEAFALAVKDLFPAAFVITRAVFITVDQRKRKEQRKDYAFDPKKDIDLKKFWTSPEFREMFESIHKKRLFNAKLIITGWTHLTIDPTNEESHVSMAGFFSFNPVLRPGGNAFVVRALGADGAVLQSESVELFYANDYTDTPDESGNRIRFHADLFEENCSGCHDTELPESALLGGESVEDQCAPCHTPLLKQTSSHFPVESWDCISCHDAGATPAYALYADKDYDTEACFECHSGIEEETTNSAVIHYPATDRCMSCHDPHSSPSPSLLVDDVFTICASCHEESATTPHPIVNHPMSTVYKPSKEPSVVECSSCHLPHAAVQPKLLKTTRKQLCKNCHNF